MAADASFNTVIVSISLGFIRLKLRSGIPSITYKGAIPPLNELMPLIESEDSSAPGRPERLLAITPAMRPAIAFETLAELLCTISAPFTVAIEPVNVDFFCEP